MLSPMRGRFAWCVWFVVAAGCGDDSSAVDAATADAGADASVDAFVPLDTFLPESFEAPRPLVDHVDPLIGTGGLGFSVGSVSPAPQRPFGLARPAPDTATEAGSPGFSHCAGYNHFDHLIQGFSQVRPHGMGIAEYGVVALMPTDGMDASKTNKVGYGNSFSHDDETVEVGYYDVTMADGIRVELTAGERVARHRYTFPTGMDNTVLLDVGHFIGEIDILDGEVTYDAETNEVRGHSTFAGGYSNRFGGMTVYFVARLEQSPTGSGVWSDGVLSEGTTMRGTAAGAWFSFDERSVEIAVGLSFTDVEHAAMNLDAEPENFDDMRTATRDAWEPLLERALITARTEREHRLFYSALYRSLLMPTLASDTDGTYRGFDGELHSVHRDGLESFRYYTDHSLWDTFRTQGPLLSLLYPELQRDMVESLMAMAREGGFMPRWPLGTGYTGGMAGDSADIWFGDAYLKGVPFDVTEAYALLRVTAMAPTPEGAAFGGRKGIASYMTFGWVPTDEGSWTTSHTLEFAYDDAVLAVLAEAAGESEDAALLRMRSGNWRNLYDPDSGFILGRAADGSFPAEPNLDTWQDYYAEGTAWQYLWYVPHDLAGLAEAMGGEAVMHERLLEFFERSKRNRLGPEFPPTYYWHGNEPDIHAPWIFSALGDPAETAEWVHWVMNRYYDDTPDGLPGNDDAGTLSAWYVFAALGVFPIAGTDTYLLGAPTVTHAVLDAPAGAITIDAPNAGLGRSAVQETRVDEAVVVGQSTHADLIGATIRFDIPAP